MRTTGAVSYTHLNLRCIPDWPIKGVNFRDVSTLFKNPASLKEISDEMYEPVSYTHLPVGEVPAG